MCVESQWYISEKKKGGKKKKLCLRNRDIKLKKKIGIKISKNEQKGINQMKSKP